MGRIQNCLERERSDNEPILRDMLCTLVGRVFKIHDFFLHGLIEFLESIRYMLTPQFVILNTYYLILNPLECAIGPRRTAVFIGHAYRKSYIERAAGIILHSYPLVSDWNSPQCEFTIEFLTYKVNKGRH